MEKSNFGIIDPCGDSQMLMKYYLLSNGALLASFETTPVVKTHTLLFGPWKL